MTKFWYLLKTKTNQEKKAASNIANQEVETYFPVITTKTLSKQRTEAVFPGYLFVNLDPHVTSVRAISNTRGVGRFVRFAQHLARIDADIITALRRRYDDYIDDQTPKPGQTVQIISGPFAGLNAVFAATDKDQRSYLFIQLINQTQRISVNNDQIRKVL